MQDEHEKGKKGVGATRPVQIRMQNAESLSRDQIEAFLRSSEPIEFTSSGCDERYLWVERVLRAQRYRQAGKGERGLVRA